MIEFITKGATDSLKRELSGLSKQKIAGALSKAINHTLGVANTEMNRRVRAVYNLPLAELNKGKTLIKSSSSNLTALIYASKRPLPLSIFNPVELSGEVKTKRVGGQKGAFVSRKFKSVKTGVSVTVVKGKTKTIKDAFISISSKKGIGSVIGLGRYNHGSKFRYDSRGLSETRLNSTSIYIPTVDRQVKPGVISKIASVLPARIIHEVSRLK